jgi:hypothetical protein
MDTESKTLDQVLAENEKAHRCIDQVEQTLTKIGTPFPARPKASFAGGIRSMADIDKETQALTVHANQLLELAKSSANAMATVKGATIAASPSEAAKAVMEIKDPVARSKYWQKNKAAIIRGSLGR